MPTCPNCNLRGVIYGPLGTIRMLAGWKTCPSCGGKGKIRQRNRRKCPRCHGWGQVGMVISPDFCPTCNGVGII